MKGRTAQGPDRLQQRPSLGKGSCHRRSGAEPTTYTRAETESFVIPGRKPRGAALRFRCTLQGAYVIHQLEAPLTGTLEPSAQVLSSKGGGGGRVSYDTHIHNPGILQSCPSACSQLPPTPILCPPKEDMGGAIPSLGFCVHDLFLST